MSIYVVGHKNPDTDSICAALGYATFKQAMGEDAVAIRCGEIRKPSMPLITSMWQHQYWQPRLRLARRLFRWTITRLARPLTGWLRRSCWKSLTIIGLVG